jgi:tetratricopeptide (TPR) repeat protein
MFVSLAFGFFKEVFRVPRRIACYALLLGLVIGPELMAQSPTPKDAEVAKGVKAVDEGDYDAAILTLDNAARRLAADPTKVKDLSEAYLYLGIAYVGKGHESAAKAKFREALTQIKDLSLSPDKFPPKVIDVFEAAREENKSAAPQAAEKKGGSRKGLWIGAGVVAAGGGVALAAKGGGSKSPTDARIFDIVVSGPGALDASVTWGDGTVLYQMKLSDENYADVAFSNRLTNTSSQLTANVTPQRSTPTSSYHLYLNRPDRSGPIPFTLTVRHP